MELQDLLEVNIDVLNILNSSQIELPLILKGMINDLIKKNQEKLDELYGKY